RQTVDGVVDADGLKYANGHQVPGKIQRLAQPKRSIEFAVVVLRAPGLLLRGVVEYDRGVMEDGCGGKATLKGAGVYKGLEAGAWLTARLGRPVEVAGAEIKAPHQGADGAIQGVQGHQGRLGLR